MDDVKILSLLELSRQYTNIRRMIHACNLEYDQEGADEYESKARSIYERGQSLRASMSDEEIAEFERRLRAGEG